jgi:hypothetical protein
MGALLSVVLDRRDLIAERRTATQAAVGSAAQRGPGPVAPPNSAPLP